MTSSAIPAVEEAMVELLEASPDLEGVHISGDREPTRANEYLWLFKASSDSDFGTIGGIALDETITLSLRVFVNGDLPKSRNRAQELAKFVEEAVYADVTLKGSNLFERRSHRDDEPVSLDKPAFQVLMTFIAKARI